MVNEKDEKLSAQPSQPAQLLSVEGYVPFDPLTNYTPAVQQIAQDSPGYVSYRSDGLGTVPEYDGVKLQAISQGCMETEIPDAPAIDTVNSLPGTNWQMPKELAGSRPRRIRIDEDSTIDRLLLFAFCHAVEIALFIGGCIAVQAMVQSSLKILLDASPLLIFLFILSCFVSAAAQKLARNKQLFVTGIAVAGTLSLEPPKVVLVKDGVPSWYRVKYTYKPEKGETITSEKGMSAKDYELLSKCKEGLTILYNEKKSSQHFIYNLKWYG